MTLDALLQAMNYSAGWYILALVAVVFIGIETRGRTIDGSTARLPMGSRGGWGTVITD